MKRILFTFLACAMEFITSFAIGFTPVKSLIAQNPVVGRSRKHLGNAVAFTRYGKNIWREKPLKVKRNDTILRVQQREAMKDAFKLVQLSIAYARIGFAYVSTSRSAFSTAMSKTLKAGYELVGTYPVIKRVVLANAPLSEGNCPIPNISAHTHISATNCTITIDKPLDILGNAITGTYYVRVAQRIGATIDGVRVALANALIGSGSTTVMSITLPSDFDLVTNIDIAVFYKATNQGLKMDSISPSALLSIA